MVADQRHESAAFQHLCRECIAAFFNQPQFLMFRVSHGENHAAAFRKLSEERLWDPRSGRGDEYGIKRGKFRETQCAIAAVYMRVWVPKPRERCGSSGSKLRPPLDREHLFD